MRERERERVHAINPSSLKEKFQVHSQLDKAEALEELTKHFLNCNLECHYPHSDTHYGVLLFLFCLSDCPVNADYVRGADSPAREGECIQ